MNKIIQPNCARSFLFHGQLWDLQEDQVDSWPLRKEYYSYFLFYRWDNWGSGEGSASQTWTCTRITGDLTTMQVLTRGAQAGTPGTSRSPKVTLTPLVCGPPFGQRGTEVPLQVYTWDLVDWGFEFGAHGGRHSLVSISMHLSIYGLTQPVLLPSKAAPCPQTLCLQTVPSIATLLPASSAQAPRLYRHSCPGLSDPSSG